MHGIVNERVLYRQKPSQYDVPLLKIGFCPRFTSSPIMNTSNGEAQLA